MKTYSKFETLVNQSAFSVCILGNLRTSDFELVDLNPEPMSEDAKRDCTRRGMEFIGVIGLVEGLPRVALECPLDVMTALALSQAFVQRVEDAINAAMKPKGDSAAWLDALYRLPDTRTDS
jgi:hypothetical protein